jgi:hypothetical protein
MSRPSSSATTSLDKTPKSRNRTNSQTSFHVRQKSHSLSSPTPPHLAGSGGKRSSGQYTSNTLNPSPLKMVTTSTTTHHRQEDPAYYYVPADAESQGYEWMVSTVIEDDDLTFGGKSLSAWYEEDRQKVSFPEEERRGRQRVRGSRVSPPNGMVAD